MMKKVGIVMGSKSDMPVVEKVMKRLESLDTPYEVRILSAHRTPTEVAEYAESARSRGIGVIIAAAGKAAALPGALAACTTLPVVGLPIKSSFLDGLDSLISMSQMPPGIPVATVGMNNALNAAILAAQILAVGDPQIAKRFLAYKEGLKKKIAAANEQLKDVHYKFKTN